MILDIQIKNNKQDIDFTINSRSHDVEYVFLDSFDNRDNYTSSKKSDHTYTIYNNSMEHVVNGTNKTYTITAKQLGMDRITRLWIMTIMYTDGEIETRIVYDLLELYCVRMSILKTCNVCGDMANQKMLTTLMFREMLLRNSIGFNHIQDSLQYYEDIFRPFKNSAEISSCINGQCAIK